ncbi:MAG: BatD family protein, partial [Planctomycetota bacterium]|nr:BatD family protein [Planctomycetota bacterium]
MNLTTNGGWIRLLVTTLFVACSAGATAQEVAVSYTADKTWVDTPIQIQFTIENARDIGDPELPDVEGLEIEYLGITNEFSQTSIINGVRTSKRSVSLSVAVNPVRAGIFTIPPISIEVDGKPYGSSSISIEAVAPTNDGRVLVEVTGPDRPVFFGEAVELTLEIWIEQFVSELYDVEASESVTWQLVDLNQTQWGPFLESIKELVNARRKPSGALRIRDGRRYFVYELRREVRPANLGELERLTDVTLAVSYPSGVRRSRSVFNSGLEFSGLVPLRVRAERSDMEVLPLPETDRPADFRGAVGEFLVRASATP